MQVGVMGMGVAQWFVTVPVRMRLGHRPLVQVLVLGVMDMGVLMLQRLILMVDLAFSQVKSQADTHWYAGQTKLHGGRFAQKPNCDHRTDEAGEREIRPGPNRSQITQRQQEQHKVDANAEEPDCHSSIGNSFTRQICPAHQADGQLTTPAARPLAMAICTGSADDSLRVRLVSTPQHRQAATMKAAPKRMTSPARCTTGSPPPERSHTR